MIMGAKVIGLELAKNLWDQGQILNLKVERQQLKLNASTIIISCIVHNHYLSQFFS